MIPFFNYADFTVCRETLCFNVLLTQPLTAASASSCVTQAFSSYYKGGFEQKMSKREASLILGIR